MSNSFWRPGRFGWVVVGTALCAALIGGCAAKEAAKNTSSSSGTTTKLADGLTLYDDFSAADSLLDRSKWNSVNTDFVRVPGYLVPAPNTQAGTMFMLMRTDGTANGQANKLSSTATTQATTLTATVTVLRYEETGTTGSSNGRAMARLRLFSTQATPVDQSGDIIAEAGLANTTPIWKILQCNDATCSQPTRLYGASMTFTTDPTNTVPVGSPAILTVAWDAGTHTVTFSVTKLSDSDVAAHSVDITTLTTPALSIGNAAPYLAETSIGLAAKPTAAGDDAIMVATFDDVIIGGSLYDNFSGTSGIDGMNWVQPIFARAVNNGRLESAVQSQSSTSIVRSNLAATPPTVPTAASADMQMNIYEAAANSRSYTRLVGFFYNDGSSTGATDRTGDIWGSVGLQGTRAVYSIGRCSDSACNTSTLYTTDTIDGNPGRVTLGSTVTGSMYTLYVQWDGTKFTFQLDDQTPVSVTRTSVGAPARVGAALSPYPFVLGAQANSQGDGMFAEYDNVKFGAAQTVQ